MKPPLCFILMPFGKKPTNTGLMIDFDAIYRDLIASAITESGLEPLRADEEMAGGIIHKPMFERLILCEYAIADLTTANANVFYELGVRHAVRPWSTVLLFAKGSGQLPFDVAPLRAMAYILNEEGLPKDIEANKTEIVKRLKNIKENQDQDALVDSPIFQLVEGFPDIDHTKTDVFRDRVQYSASIKKQISDARKQGKDALINLEKQLGDIKNLESGVVIDLFLTYRAVKAWQEMINLVQKMSSPLSNTIMVQEQLALALNRNGQGEEAERALLELLERRGPSSETYGILGRVYKDRWETAYKNGDEILASGLLDKSIEAYLKGFEADWRDAYPGINAITLMEIKEPPDPRRTQLISVVEYSVGRRIATGKPDYWDYATLLELAILGKDKQKAIKSLSSALTLLRESWEAETTLRNLRLISEARERRQEAPVEWTKQIEQALKR
jgi:tetratricopeptide (TPR) repeat protein